MKYPHTLKFIKSKKCKYAQENKGFIKRLDIKLPKKPKITEGDRESLKISVFKSSLIL